jgi:hypothetical protein
MQGCAHLLLRHRVALLLLGRRDAAAELQLATHVVDVGVWVRRQPTGGPAFRRRARRGPLRRMALAESESENEEKKEAAAAGEEQ